MVGTKSIIELRRMVGTKSIIELLAIKVPNLLHTTVYIPIAFTSLVNRCDSLLNLNRAMCIGVTHVMATVNARHIGGCDDTDACKTSYSSCRWPRDNIILK
jgi:hypothetical protein